MKKIPSANHLLVQSAALLFGARVITGKDPVMND